MDRRRAGDTLHHRTSSVGAPDRATTPACPPVRSGVPGRPRQPEDGVSEGYPAFLARKSQLDGGSGFTPLWLPGFLFDFQAALVDWALCQGRGAILAVCGPGKTPMPIDSAQNGVREKK